MSDSLNRSLSSLSLNSVDSQPEDDWDRSLTDVVAVPLPSTPPHSPLPIESHSTTPRNSVVFPAEDTPGRHSRYSSSQGVFHHNKSSSVDKQQGKRTLSELLRLHSEKGCGGKFSPDEASRIADVLGEWINASSSPYESEDDFFARSSQSQDDISIATKRLIPAVGGRPRGRSESANSLANNQRPPSSTGFPAPS